jgi:putative transposase
MTGVRVCVDVRLLNQYLKEDDRFPLPHIPEMLAAFSGGKLFGEYDLSEAYFQFKLKEESQQYTAFTWNKQQYVFVGCPFGIKHIPSLFQRYICNLFRDMPYVFPYI